MFKESDKTMANMKIIIIRRRHIFLSDLQSWVIWLWKRLRNQKDLKLYERERERERVSTKDIKLENWREFSEIKPEGSVKIANSWWKHWENLLENIEYLCIR